MAIGRTFQESLQKACDRWKRAGGLGLRSPRKVAQPLRNSRQTAHPQPRAHFRPAPCHAVGLDGGRNLSAHGYRPWFLYQLAGLLKTEKFLKRTPLQSIDAHQMMAVKRQGFSDRQIAFATNTAEDQVRTTASLGVIPVYKTVDTCAAEFEAYTPYYYSTYEDELRCCPAIARR
jgi:carbamoyl-phosphate synthase large subunit